MIETKINKLKDYASRIKDNVNLSIVLSFLDWFLRKMEIHFEKEIAQDFVPEKWDIYFIDLWNNIWSEENKRRPCSVYSTKRFNQSNTVVVLTIKSFYWKINKEYEILIEPNEINWLQKKSLIRITQIRTVSKQRFGGKIGTLDKELLEQIDKKISSILDIKKPTNDRQTF